jgi:hypothetical protein
MKRNLAAALLFTLVAVPADRAGEKKKESLPGFPGIEADAALLEVRGVFKISKTGTDFKGRIPSVWWVLEVQTDNVDFDEIKKAWGLTTSAYLDKGPHVLFKDDDRVLILESQLLVQGMHTRLQKGDGIRVVLVLPDRGIMDKTRFVTISQ